MDNLGVEGKEGLIDTLNADEVRRLTPLLVFLSVILFAGLPGNILVILVYRRSYKNSNSKMFVLWLAVIDLLNCLILTLEIVNVVHQYNYPSTWLCKFTIFITLWPTLMSGLSLCAISFERYRKVCRPLGWQMSHRFARILCLVIVGVALFLSWPSLILFGLRDIQIQTFNVTGHECMFQNKYDGTASLKIYSGLLWMIFVSSLIVLVGFYSLIGRRVYKQLESRQRRKSNIVSHFNLDKQQIKTVSGGLEESTASTSSAFENRHSLVSTSALAIHRTTSRQDSARQSQAKKSAFIMFIISLIFVISFIPHLVMRLLESMDKTFVSDMSDGGRAAYKFLLRSYFLNSASNPFIYCMCLPPFRQDALALIRSIWRR